MPMHNLSRNYNAEGAINAYSIVKYGAADYGALQADSATAKLLGVASDIAAASGEPVDVIYEGIATVKLGGTVTRGDWLVSDASGNAIVSAAAAGTNNESIGKALQSGVSGDLIDVMIVMSRIQG